MADGYWYNLQREIPVKNQSLWGQQEAEYEKFNEAEGADRILTEKGLKRREGESSLDDKERRWWI